jgi:hypothetical protein
VTRGDDGVGLAQLTLVLKNGALYCYQGFAIGADNALVQLTDTCP